MKILGLIPARGGSQRLPGKNLRPLNGYPLLFWTLNAVVSVPEITHVAVTTDHEKTGEIFLGWMGACVTAQPAEWVVRPKHLAQGTTPPIQNVQHAIGWYRERHDIEFEHIVLLQPTSPLRSVQDIRDAIRLHLDRGGDAVVSVTEAGERWVYEIGHADRLRPVSTRPSEKLASPNGATFIIRREAMDAGEDWWSGITYAHFMPPARSIDIDTAEDFAMAEKLIRGLAYDS